MTTKFEQAARELWFQVRDSGYENAQKCIAEALAKVDAEARDAAYREGRADGWNSAQRGPANQ